MNTRLDRTTPAAAVLHQDLPRVTRATAEHFATVLFNDLSAGPRSGEHHSGLPRRSSAPGEPEQRQSGDLQDSIDVRQVSSGDLAYATHFGFFDEDLGKLAAIEINDENPRYRGWLEHTATDPDTQEEAKRAGVDTVAGVPQ